MSKWQEFSGTCFLHIQCLHFEDGSSRLLRNGSSLLPGQKTNIRSAAGNAPPFEESDYSLPCAQQSNSGHHRQLHTIVSSKPSSAPHHRQLHTTVSSTPPSAPHHRQLHTTVSSTPPSAPHPPSLLLIINFNGNLYFTRAFVSDIPTISL